MTNEEAEAMGLPTKGSFRQSPEQEKEEARIREMAQETVEQMTEEERRQARRR